MGSRPAVLRVFAVLGLLRSAVPAAAQETPLTLAEALALSESQNPDLLAARVRAEAQAIRAESLARTRWPRLLASSGWTRADNPAMVFAQKLNAGGFDRQDLDIARLNDPDALSHLTTVLAVEAPIDLFGKVGDRAAGQAALGRAAGAAARETTQWIRLRVVEAYHGTLLAAHALGVTDRALATARSREADIEARVASGIALKADLLRARARRREREADLAVTRGEVRVAAARLGRLLGAPPGVTYWPTDRPGPPAPLDGGEAAWTARALAQRPAVAAAQERVEAARWVARAERRSWLPDLTAHGQIQDHRSGFSAGKRTGMVGAMVIWNAFDPTRTKRLAMAEAELRAAEQEARAAQDQVRLEVETAWRRALASRESHAAAAGGAEEGREALRVVQERRQTGMATITDDLETEVAGLAAELGEAAAATEAAIADAGLKAAAGEL